MSEILKIDQWLSVKQGALFEPLYTHGTLVAALRKSDGKEFELEQLVYNYLDNNVEKICGFCQDFIHVELETMRVPINQINQAKRLEVAAYTLLQSLKKTKK